MESTTGKAEETSLRRVAGNQAEYRRLRLYTWLWALFVAGVVLALLFTVWLFGVTVRDAGMAPAVQPGDVILFDRLSSISKRLPAGISSRFRTQRAKGCSSGGSLGCRVKR